MRLIDADLLQKTYCDDNCGDRKCVDAMDRCVFIGAVLEAPTVSAIPLERIKLLREEYLTADEFVEIIDAMIKEFEK